MKPQFNKTYFIIFIVLFITEAFIATFLKTGFIRHTFGDFLVVILIYAGIKSILPIKPIVTAIGVLLLSFTIEFLQMANFLKHVNLQNNDVAILVLGSTFQTSDLIAYTLGIATVLIVEYKLLSQHG